MAGTITLNKHLEKWSRIGLAKPLRILKTLRELLPAMLKAQQMTVSIDGGDITEIKDGSGIHIRVTPGETALVPWTVKAGSAGNKRVITSGTIGGVTPTIDGTRLDATPAPQLTISTIAVNYIYLRCAFDKTVIDGFVAGATLVQGAVSVIASATGSAAALDTGDIRHIPIGTINLAGVVTSQPHRHSLDWSFSDTGDGSATLQISVFF